MLNKIDNEVDITIMKKIINIVKHDNQILRCLNNNLINNLINYSKVLSFNKNDYLFRKGEPINYMFIILKGEIIQQYSDKIITYLDIGDSIGYMSILEISNSTMFSNFNYIGKTEGYILIITKLDFLNMKKKNPELYYILNNSLISKTYNLIKKQFIGYNKNNNMLKEVDITTNYAIELIYNNKKLSLFFKNIQKKYFKLFLSKIKYYEFENGQKIFEKNKKNNNLYFILKGEIVSYKKMKAISSYKEGDCINFINIINNNNFKHDMYSKLNGILISIPLKDIEEIGLSNSELIIKLYTYLLKQEILNITNELENIFEIEMNDNLLKQNDNTNYIISPISNYNYINNDILNDKNLLTIDKNPKDYINSFLLNKLNNQSKNKTNKQNNNINNNKKIKNLDSLYTNLLLDHEELNNNLLLLKDNLEQEKSENYKKDIIIESLKNDIKNLKNNNLILNTKINKFYIQHELLNKNNNKNIKTNIENNNSNKIDTFKEQLSNINKINLIKKCIKKWKQLIKK